MDNKAKFEKLLKHQVRNACSERRYHINQESKSLIEFLLPISVKSEGSGKRRKRRERKTKKRAKEMKRMKEKRKEKER